jgi:hypothetical protein
MRQPKITPALRRRYLAALAEGCTRSEAARKAGKDLTGTMFRNLEHREEGFAIQAATAQREGAAVRADKIHEQFENRAFDADRPSMRALEVLAATHVDEYRWLRRGAAARGPDGPGGSIEAAIDPELLTREQLLQLIELVKMGQGLIPNPELQHEPRQLAAGDQVIDVEEEAVA